MPERRLAVTILTAVLLGLGAALLLRSCLVESRDRPRRPLPSGASLNDRLRNADAATGARLFGPCAACHSVRRGGADLEGPNLYGVVGRPVAERRPRFAYSAALRHAGGAWSFARLDAWLTNPAAFASGTTMGFPGLADAQDRADVIAFLNRQGSDLPFP